jgi:hypothetical protein
MPGLANSLNITQPGYVVFNDTTGTFQGRTFQAGTGITISNASGISGNSTISATNIAFAWIDATAATQNIVVNNGYVTNRVAGVTYTLPPTANFGEVFRIAGKSGAWTISQNAGQQIVVGSASSTVGVTGSVASTNAGDCIELLCITSGASTVWRALSFVGNLTIT